MSSHATRRGNCFDALRLFAALAVVVGHSTAHLDAKFLWYETGSGLWFFDGVVAFFILSGLMVYRSAERCAAEKQPWREFYRNRALRVVPAIYLYAAAMILILVAVGALNTSELRSTQFGAFLASHLALIPVYHPAIFADFGVGVVNGSLWTISVEVSFYLTVPLIVIAAARFGFRKALGGTFLIAVVGVVAYQAVEAGGEPGTLGKLYGVTFLAWLWFFALGVLWTRLWPLAPKSGWLAVAGIAGYVACVAFGHVQDAEMTILITAVAAVPLSYSLVWTGYFGPDFMRRMTDRIGDLSFGTYVWHMPVVNLLIFAGAKSWDVPGTAMVLLVIVTTLSVAAASWWMVERPALKRKKYSLRREGVPLVK